MVTASNRSYDRLSQLGKNNPRNRVDFPLADSVELGVSMERSGSKKAATMELLIPARRSGRGARRALAVTINGAQARKIFETLRAYYDAE